MSSETLLDNGIYFLTQRSISVNIAPFERQFKNHAQTLGLFSAPSPLPLCSYGI